MSRFHPLPLAVRALRFQQLAAMEKAGLPADRAYALLDLGAQAKARLNAFRRLVAKGADPATAGGNSGLLTPFETRLLRAAFASGSPLPSYQRLAAGLATRAAQAGALRARLVLPAGILALALFVQPLPRLFNGALSMGGYLFEVLAPLAIIAVLGMTAVRVGAWFAAGEAGGARPALERALLAMPLFGRLHLRRNVRDFSDSLALLLGAGLPLFEALPLAVATAGNQLVRADLASLLPAVQGGAPLAQAIGALRVVDTVTLFAMIHTGEESGSLPEMLTRYADAESASLALAQQELITWLPRLLYACVALWMAAQLLRPLWQSLR